MKLSKKQVDEFYKSWAWVNCRQTVLARDLGLCQECLKDGIPTPANTVHHIVHYRDDPTRALDIDNLVSVCMSCHNKLHPEKRNKNAKMKAKKESKKIKVVRTKANPERFW